MKIYTVKEVSSLIGKHEETIKRWIRSGKLPNSYRNSDKEGWRILESDLLHITEIVLTKEESHTKSFTNEEDTLIKLAYEAVTLTSPNKEIYSVLSVVGIKRTLEILLIMQQSATKVKNPDGFIKKAIRENWSPTTLPVKIPKKQNKHLSDLTQQDYDAMQNKAENTYQSKIALYNWLED
ncbi:MULTISPECIES: helix-turn-helix domain-containing protein [Bacillus cereus group]|uniref:helix-turn-helix domain-containing protein n=1 Tax=Bacillus cereus group TaxID=86661 RepID=UPI000BEF9FF7|nr:MULTISPECIES: helix-turn-helix domain-containing protein [Bacillus cereus group]PEO35928.1 DNA-binding protein [Bacillus wiedmannii]QWG70817.1 DNA-binding protein [Bacillus mycoides]QWH23367.1 DNA-binding protein [Bacillus mycoides]